MRRKILWQSQERDLHDNKTDRPHLRGSHFLAPSVNQTVSDTLNDDFNDPLRVFIDLRQKSALGKKQTRAIDVSSLPESGHLQRTSACRFGPTADIKHAAAQPGRSMPVTEPFRDRTGVQALAKNACFGLGRTPGQESEIRGSLRPPPATGATSGERAPRGVSVLL